MSNTQTHLYWYWDQTPERAFAMFHFLIELGRKRKVAKVAISGDRFAVTERLFPQQRMQWGFSMSLKLVHWVRPGRVRIGWRPLCSRGAPVVLPWCSRGAPVGPRLVHWVRPGRVRIGWCPRCSRGAPVVLSRCSRGAPV